MAGCAEACVINASIGDTEKNINELLMRQTIDVIACPLIASFIQPYAGDLLKSGSKPPALTTSAARRLFGAAAAGSPARPQVSVTCAVSVNSPCTHVPTTCSFVVVPQVATEFLVPAGQQQQCFQAHCRAAHKHTSSCPCKGVHLNKFSRRAASQLWRAG